MGDFANRDTADRGPSHRRDQRSGRQSSWVNFSLPCSHYAQRQYWPVLPLYVFSVSLSDPNNEGEKCQLYLAIVRDATLSSFLTLNCIKGSITLLFSARTSCFLSASSAYAVALTSDHAAKRDDSPKSASALRSLSSCFASICVRVIRRR